MTRADLLLAVAGLTAGIAGVGWLAPLMFDQLVLFGDQEQTAAAAASRSVMVGPLGLIVLGAVLNAISGRSRDSWAAVVALAPIISVGLAFAAPERAWQLFTYLATAPMSIGAHLAVVRPIALRGSSLLPV